MEFLHAFFLSLVQFIFLVEKKENTNTLIRSDLYLERLYIISE